MSQPPGEPQSGGESTSGNPDEPDEQVESAEPDPGSTRYDSSPGDPAPGSAASASADSAPRPAAPPSAPEGGGQPWWSQAQPPPPPGGHRPPPPPYQQQGAPPPPYQQPWGYGRQAPPGPPPGAPRWTRPAAAGDVPAERDRLSLHLLWEGVLALVVVVLLVATAMTTPHQNLTVAISQAGYFGLLATGLAFSMRTGSPNLAVGSILFFSSSLSAHLISESGWSKPAAFLVAILLSTLIGLVLGLVVAVLSVPSWAATLGAIAVIQAVVLAFAKNPIIPVRFGGSYPTALWYGLFFVLSVGGGALWLVPAVRRPLSGVRAPGDPARWLGLRAGLGTIVGLTGSSFLAGLAAVPLLMRTQASGPGASVDITFALAAVLLGGVSVFGRRAGVFGTFIAVTILALVQTLVIYNGGPIWALNLIVGLAALAGLVVSRALEGTTDMLNRRRPAPFTPPQAMAPQLPPAPQ